MHATSSYQAVECDIGTLIDVSPQKTLSHHMSIGRLILHSSSLAAACRIRAISNLRLHSLLIMQYFFKSAFVESCEGGSMVQSN